MIKGHNNYKQYAKFTEQGIFFVTRQRENAVYDIAVECLHDESTSSNIFKETIIIQNYKDELNNLQTLKLRRIAWYDEKHNRSYEFITNSFELDAQTIALLYKYRWKIELFFKKLKQNFPLQYFKLVITQMQLKYKSDGSDSLAAIVCNSSKQ